MSLVEGRDGERTSREAADLSWISASSAGLGIVLVFLSFARVLPFDVRWCAPLACAWLNLSVIANGARLSMQGRAAPARVPGWRLLARASWRAVHRQRSTDAFFIVIRSIAWQPWGAFACACVSMAATTAAWLPLEPAALVRALVSPAYQIVNGAILLLFAFLILIAERNCQARADRSRVAASLVRMLRVCLLVTLAAAASTTWLTYAGTTPDWLLRAAAAFGLAIAAELALRAALLMFLPPSRRASICEVPTSAIAGVLQWHPSPVAAFGAALQSQYGIDLRQNWALWSSARLLPAALASVAVCAWLLTGVIILGPEERAVYERFGAPVAVWQPGPHAGLPWPFGKARLVDNGAVHQLIVSGSADNSSVAAPSVHADDATPEPLNRLWDAAHPWETTQVIAGASGEAQAFQIVSADVRLEYRVGVSDADARAALYRANDPEGVVRSIANREVVHYLASHTLDSLLETPQTAVADAVRRQVQRQLDRIGAGIEVMAVVIESIHPPAGAAAAYHGVQSAQVRAQASVARARAYAAGELGDAGEEAQHRIAQANADAAETLAGARVQRIDFDADIGASRLGGPAFVFEYYLHKLQSGLQNAHLTVIDDRLAEGNRATLDLRAYPAGDLAGIPRNND